MRPFFIVVVVVVGASCESPTQPKDKAEDPSAALYDDAALPAFALTVPESSLEALAVSPREYAPATLTIDGEDVGDVEIHIKGEDNFEMLPGKSALKIKLAHDYKGLAHFTLNNLAEDDSLISERLAYRAFRALGLPAPRANNATLTLNGEDKGIYANVETEDEHLLARWFDDGSGNLYEEGGSDFVPGEEHTFDKETNQDADDWSDLERLTAAVAAAHDDTFLDDIGAVIDVKSFLEYSALEGIVEQWDGYSYTRFGPNNFRIYFDPSTNLMSFIPWGLDMTFKPYEDLDLDLRDPRGMLLQRCMASTTCATQYHDTVAQTLDAIDALDLPSVAQRFHDQVPTGDASVVLATLRRRTDDIRAQLP